MNTTQTQENQKQIKQTTIPLPPCKLNKNYNKQTKQKPHDTPKKTPNTSHLPQYSV